jgi:hypothetical protein
MARWIALAITLLFFVSCSFTSTSALRGLVAPMVALLMCFVTAWLFVADRVAQNSRSDVAMMQDPETLRLMRERAARASQRNRGDGGPVVVVDTPTGTAGAKPRDRDSGEGDFRGATADGGGGGDGGGGD